tara:strand:+ start:69 stop:770 length:702 start_codon:yes stop_codon:yes gene_type:complete
MQISPEDRVKYSHYPKLIIFKAVYYYLRYALSYRDIEEILQDRGIKVDHSTLHDWVIKYTKLFEKNIHKKKSKVNGSWRMDETYIKVKGKWKYLYRAVDKYGDTIDFLLTAHRDTKSAVRFLKRAMKHNGTPTIITIDGSHANKSAIEEVNKKLNVADENKIKIRQTKYLNNIVEQDHRGIKRIYKHMLGFNNFHTAHHTLRGIEMVRMIKKGQFDKKSLSESGFETFCRIAA